MPRQTPTLRRNPAGRNENVCVILRAARLLSPACARSGSWTCRPSDQDRRVRILKPTEKLRAHDSRLARGPLHRRSRFCTRQHDYGLVMLRDPGFPGRAPAHRPWRSCPLGREDAPGGPGHDAVLQSRRRPHGCSPRFSRPRWPSPISRTTAVGRCRRRGPVSGVSRTHVRQLLVAAEEAGLVKLHARGGRRVELLPRPVVEL